MGITAAVVGIGSTILGVGTSIFGASEQNAAQQQELAISQQENVQRQHLFEIEQGRKRVEDLRNAQQASAVSRTRAANQGAQFGSGLLGGLGQIQGESNYNILGINQNSQIGENLFSLDAQMTQAKIASAAAATTQAIGGALTSFGGTVINSMGAIGNLTSGGLGSLGIRGPDIAGLSNANYAGTGAR